MPLVRVALERSIDRPDGSEGLTYRALQPAVVGERVLVPLGRGDRRASGLVVEVGGEDLAHGIPASRIKPVLEHTGARLPERLVDLARWMAVYYVCPLGMVLAAMMPAAVKRRTGLRMRTVLHRVSVERAADILGTSRLSRSLQAAWSAAGALGADAFPLPPRALADKLGIRTLAPINRLTRLGLFVASEVEEVTARGRADGAMGAALDPGAAGRPILSADQRLIVEGVLGSVSGFAAHLIRGVTGSGKTEVYLNILEHVVRGGGSALVLVPEISLTPLISMRFEARFMGLTRVAVLHSGLSASQRHKQWGMAASGEARVVIGARSAVFAPIGSLGVVVVDEEHSEDFKQDQLPRYHGRDVAIKAAQLAGCPVVLGSATPSLESWSNATGPHAKYRLWHLDERLAGGDGKPMPMPRVEVVDMRQQYREQALREAHAGREHRVHALRPIGPRLEGALAETLEAGGQAMLLLNRRGFASYVSCPDRTCGWVMRCRHCDASMVYHKRWLRSGAAAGWGGGYVRCHHCLAEQLLLTNCPVCGRRANIFGIGTQRVEEDLERRFVRFGLVRGSTLVRADGDTMGGAADWADVLGRFASGQIRVLLGTQMIAKGHDFPNVRLVGVVDADTALHLPDFRASERTFQLVSQVAGRAGRGGAPGAGLVIVQTFNPDLAAIRYAARHDFAGFAEEELACRRESGLPPATRMVRVVFRHKDFERATEHAASVALLLKGAAEQVGASARFRMLGPMPCAIARVGGMHRISIELISPDRGLLQTVLARVRAMGMLKSDAATAVDVDPVSLI